MPCRAGAGNPAERVSVRSPRPRSWWTPALTPRPSHGRASWYHGNKPCQAADPLPAGPRRPSSSSRVSASQSSDPGCGPSVESEGVTAAHVWLWTPPQKGSDALPCTIPLLQTASPTREVWKPAGLGVYDWAFVGRLATSTGVASRPANCG